jgi:hypothetical protein
MTSKRQPVQIDRNKFRAKARKLFADEGGSWQVGVDWPKVLPVWFKVLAATVEPEEYARRITALLSRHCHYDRDKMRAIAARAATTEQRKALAEVKSA